MKTSIATCLIFAAVIIYSCKKEYSRTGFSNDSYSSVNDFFEKNAVKTQTYVINATSGGSFTSPQGTLVAIPANAFALKQAQPLQEM